MSKTKMIFFLLILSLIGITSTLARAGKSIRNPAMVYCNEMGYQYEIRIDPEGNEYGVCIFPDETECDAWDFLKGKAGKPFSYCVKNGYDIETKKANKGTYQFECAECVAQSEPEETSIPEEDGAGIVRKKSRIPMLELMAKRGKKLAFEMMSPKRRKTTSRQEDFPVYFDNATKYNPISFDWRNVNGHSYIGAIRDQGNCGSCYAFGALASAEGVYNIATGNFDDNCVDFSESFLIWCLGGMSQYNDHFYGCDGADWDYAELTALMNEGIFLESDFPYTTAAPGICPLSGDPPVGFLEWGRIPCGDIEAMKAAIATYGVMDVAVYVSSNFNNYTTGVFVDENTSCNFDPCYSNNGTNHAVSLVGWGHNDIAGDYWILRNSWGSSWGENGYMRIGVSSARVSCEATYLIYGPRPPIANFTCTNTTVCAGSPVKLHDLSTGNPTSWNWTFAPDSVEFVNGTDRYSQVPEVRFEEGIHTISLEVENHNGSDNITKPDFLTVIDGQMVRLDVVFDRYPQETTLELDGFTFSRGPFSVSQQSYREDVCLPEGTYTLIVSDSYGDGMCCSYGYGHYSLKNLTTGETITDSVGSFSHEESTEFCIGCPVCRTAANREHRKEGRAFYDGQGANGVGYYAVGSNQFLGESGKILVQVKEQPEGYFSIGRCSSFPIRTTANNRDHKKAGRAFKKDGTSGYGYYAVGSNDFMGESGRAVTELTESSLNYHEMD